MQGTLLALENLMYDDKMTSQSSKIHPELLGALSIHVKMTHRKPILAEKPRKINQLNKDGNKLPNRHVAVC